MKQLKNNKPDTTTTWIYGCSALLCILLPLTFIHLQYDRWNPFRLNGKNFLVFYILLLLLCHTMRHLERRFTTSYNRQGYWTRVLALLIFVTGLARLIQGIYHAKPVGYLVLLMALHLILLIFQSPGRTTNSLNQAL